MNILSKINKIYPSIHSKEVSKFISLESNVSLYMDPTTSNNWFYLIPFLKLAQNKKVIALINANSSPSTIYSSFSSTTKVLNVPEKTLENLTVMRLNANLHGFYFDTLITYSSGLSQDKLNELHLISDQIILLSEVRDHNDIVRHYHLNKNKWKFLELPNGIDENLKGSISNIDNFDKIIVNISKNDSIIYRRTVPKF